MPFDGNGTFTPLTPDYPAVADELIDATKVNNILDDIALGLSNAVTRDGQSPMTQNLPMGTKKVVNMGDGTADQDAVTLTQVRDNMTFHGMTSDAAVDFTDATTIDTRTSDLFADTQLSTDDSEKVATTAFVQQVAMNAALPNQAGQPANAVVKTDGAGNAGWSALKTIKGASLFGAGDLNPQAIAYEARAVNTIFGAADLGKFIEYTGSFTQTYGTAASLGADWWVVVKNNFTDSVYHTPAGGATIDGVTDFLQYPGEARLIQCDGTNFHSVILHPFSLAFTASGFFFKPPGYKAFEGELWGAGGSGCMNDTVQYKSGGGGGGCAKFTIQASALGTSETVTIGAGGAAVSNPVPGTGNAGGNSTFGSLFTAYGGEGGKAAAAANDAQTDGGSAFTTGSGNPAISPATGIYRGYLAGGSANSNTGYSSVYGGGGGDGFNNATPGSGGGTSVFGGAGGAASAAGAAGAGTAPGGAGGATRTGTSGAGARGELRIRGIV